MKHSFPTSHDNQFDTRPLLASEAKHGALVGFCWSLALMVPVVFVNAVSGDGSFLWTLVAMAVVCPVWSAIAAFVEVDRTREKTFTDEQRAVLRGRIHVARLVAVGLTFLAFFALANVVPGTGPWGFVAVLAIAAIWVGSYLVGRANGHAAIRMMQRHTRDAASRIHADTLGVVEDDSDSERVQPSRERFTEPRSAPAEANSLSDVGAEDR